MFQIGFSLFKWNLVDNSVTNNLSKPYCRQRKVQSFQRKELFCTLPTASYWAKQNGGPYVDFGFNNKSSQYWEKAPHRPTPPWNLPFSAPFQTLFTFIFYPTTLRTTTWKEFLTMNRKNLYIRNPQLSRERERERERESSLKEFMKGSLNKYI